MDNDPYTDCLCLAARRFSRLLTQVYDHELASLGLRITQFSILAALDRTSGQDMPLSEVASALDLEASTFSRSIAALSERGLVRIEPGADRRERLAQLTTEGRAVLHAALPLWQKAQDKVKQKVGADWSGAIAALPAAIR